MEFEEYRGLRSIVAGSPEELIEKINEITHPFKILGFVNVGARQCAYIVDDVKAQKPIKKKGV